MARSRAIPSTKWQPSSSSSRCDRIACTFIRVGAEHKLNKLPHLYVRASVRASEACLACCIGKVAGDKGIGIFRAHHELHERRERRCRHVFHHCVHTRLAEHTSMHCSLAHCDEHRPRGRVKRQHLTCRAEQQQTGHHEKPSAGSTSDGSTSS